jgi:hypothetical protein
MLPSSNKDPRSMWSNSRHGVIESKQEKKKKTARRRP